MAFALLAHTTAGSLDANVVTTPAIDTTGANLLVVAVAQYLYTRTVTFTDSKSNSWTTLTQIASPDDPCLNTYYCQNPTVGASHTFTVTSDSAVTYPAIAVASFSGAVLTGVLDGQVGFNATPNMVTTVQSGSLTPAENNELFIAALGWTTVSTTVSIGSSFTITDLTNYGGDPHLGVALAYKIQTTAGAENPLWTLGATNYEPSAKLITFKSLAVVTPGGGKRRLMGMGA
jgi:hypothetical protein